MSANPCLHQGKGGALHQTPETLRGSCDQAPPGTQATALCYPLLLRGVQA
jgi:hypothetical protein